MTAFHESNKARFIFFVNSIMNKPSIFVFKIFRRAEVGFIKSKNNLINLLKQLLVKYIINIFPSMFNNKLNFVKNKLVSRFLPMLIKNTLHYMIQRTADNRKYSGKTIIHIDIYV